MEKRVYKFEELCCKCRKPHHGKFATECLHGYADIYCMKCWEERGGRYYEIKLYQNKEIKYER